MLDEVFALNTSLSERPVPNAKGILTSQLKCLSATDGEALRQRCLSEGTPSAMYLLGVCFYEGLAGHPQKTDHAVEWFRKSADLGESRAMNTLGYCLKHGLAVDRSPDPDDQSDGTSQRNAISWYRRSASLGNSDAMYSLGRCLCDGNGVSKDEKEAVEWYRKSADLGNSQAMNSLGYCLDEGIAGIRDEAEAIFWYRKAKTAESYWNLALISKDPFTAMKYYSRAYSLFPEGEDRDECLQGIRNLHNGDLIGEIIQRCVLHDDEVEALQTENQRLKTQNEELRTELEYRPGGAGFEEARRDFESHLSVPADASATP